MIRLLSVVGGAALSILYAEAASASGKIYYGSRAGMTVSVVSVDGLNSTHAVIRTVHTRDDATAFCRDYEQNLTEECVKRELAIPMNDYIAARAFSAHVASYPAAAR